jgi:hypothetical protein
VRSIGYDDFLPHDLLHFVSEAEFGLDGAVFGDLAAGGNARIFQPMDPKPVAKMWRKERKARTGLPDGRRSEELAWELERDWRARTLRPELQQSSTASRSAGTHYRWAARSRSSGRGRKEGVTGRASEGGPRQRDGVSVRACLPARAVPA